MSKQLARAMMALLTAAASVAGITTTAQAAPGDVYGFDLDFTNSVGSPVGQIDANHLVLKGNGTMDLVLRGQGFTPDSRQRITIHKGTCAAPGAVVDTFEIDAALDGGDPTVTGFPTAQRNDGTPGAFRYAPGQNIISIDPDDLDTFENDYVLVVDEVGTDNADYLCGVPTNRAVVGNTNYFGTAYPIYFTDHNNSGVSANGIATLIGNQLSVEITYYGLASAPTNHFQVLRSNTQCHSGDTTTEAQVGGNAELALTWGQRSLLPTDALTAQSYYVHPFSLNGEINYKTEIALTPAQAQAFPDSVIAIYGMDANGNGASDGGPSPIAAGLTADETKPAGCAQFKPFPATVADAPGLVGATVSGTSVSVYWVAPADDGGAPIDNYTVTVGNQTVTVPGTAITATIDNVPSGTSLVSVVANNSAGASAAGMTSADVADAADAPANVAASAVGGTVTVTWNAPASDGGSPITGYTAAVGNQYVDLGPGAQSVIFQDVPAGTQPVSVVATSAVGESAPGTSFVIVRDCRDGDVDADWQSIVVTNDDKNLFRLYCGYFLRYPDESGFAYWQGIQQSITSDDPLTAISDEFALSAEFSNTYGSLNSSEFVELLYANVFNRPVDATGFAYWKGLLDSGELTQGGVVRWASAGTEFQLMTGTTLS